MFGSEHKALRMQPGKVCACTRQCRWVPRHSAATLMAAGGSPRNMPCVLPAKKRRAGYRPFACYLAGGARFELATDKLKIEHLNSIDRWLANLCVPPNGIIRPPGRHAERWTAGSQVRAPLRFSVRGRQYAFAACERDVMVLEVQQKLRGIAIFAQCHNIGQ